MVFPLADSHFHAWELPRRNAKKGGSHTRKASVRRGPYASGEAASYANSAPNSPPGPQKNPVREVTNFLYAQGQRGPLPPSPHRSGHGRIVGRFTNGVSKRTRRDESVRGGLIFANSSCRNHLPRTRRRKN